MKQDKRMILSCICVVLGIVLIVLAFMEKVDAFWNGMGTALVVVGALQLLRFRRFNRNEAYREKVEIAMTDERNHYIRNKAWAWSGYLFIVIAAIMTLVFKLLGQELLSMAASGGVCLMLVLYWISWGVLRKKY